jgi:FkbM family methyltransferase
VSGVMGLNTKTLFSSILKAQRADCVCDIGSRDGDQSLLFRHLLPQAAVLAFEANPINFEVMKRDSRLIEERIEIFPCAISNQRGTAQFHVADVDYSDPKANRGTSSLLVSPSGKAKDTVTVDTYRIDDFLRKHCPASQRVGLWIDVEGAEHAVLEGMTGIKDRIVAVHVETANEAIRIGQKPLRDLIQLMSKHGFRLCGRNFGSGASEWGDVVFVREQVMQQMGFGFSLCRLKAHAGKWLRADQIAVLLKARLPWLYRALRHLYIRFGT